MAQPVITRFYNTRKRFQAVTKNADVGQSSKVLNKAADAHFELDIQTLDTKDVKGKLDVANKNETVVENKRKAPTTRKKNCKQSGVSKQQQDIRTALVPQIKKKQSESKRKELNELDSGPSAVSKLDEVFPTHSPSTQSDVSRTPKRNLSDPSELSPSKKHHVFETNAEKNDGTDSDPPFKSADHSVRRKLNLELQDRKASTDSAFLSKVSGVDDFKPTKVVSTLTLKVNAAPKKKQNSEKVTDSLHRNKTESNELTPRKSPSVENLDNERLLSLIKNSRNKILASGNLDELKKSLEKFSKNASATKKFQDNSCKITSVISTKASSGQTSAVSCEPAKTKYSYLAAPVISSLTLPYKYRLLCETFRCMDVVVSILHNRKERITFGKVQEGVQKMNNRTFTKTHIGQIISILPSAYSLYYEKYDGNICNKNDNTGYQLIIEPKLVEDSEDSSPSITQSSKLHNPSKPHAFIHMSPQHLMDRQNNFQRSILKLVKQYHKEFLNRINFPHVSDEKILRWHPKFPLDSVPDVVCAKLPETPEIKMCTAKDVLNKLRGTVKGKVQKALESVAAESKTENKSEELLNKANSAVNKKSSEALKGICTDLLEKIRARESAKLVETMMRPPEETKRLAMLENVPKIVHILWHYFVAERKSAIPVEVAVEKIIHSFNSRRTAEEVKEYLQLITEVCPGWLTFIKIPKGEYITMDKKKDINVMLSNIK